MGADQRCFSERRDAVRHFWQEVDWNVATLGSSQQRGNERAKAFAQ
ncbi:hypothetical protein [Pseudorhodoferax sp. Leaf274]|nr:hypothetical protein [Pseudorhodoferax sp. Leaf274]